VEHLQSLVEAQVAGLQGVVRADGGVDVQLEVPGAWCAQEGAVRVAEQPYVSGQRTVPNPVHAELTQQLEWARRELGPATEAEGAAARAAADADWQLQAARSAAAPLEQQLSDAWQRVQAAERAVQSARQMVAELEAQQADLEARGGSDAALAAVVITLGNLRQQLASAEDELAWAQQEVAEVQPATDAAAWEVTNASHAASSASARWEDAASNLAGAQAAVSALEQQLYATPAQLVEDVIDLFRYEVTTWTRWCEGEASLRQRSARLGERTQRFSDAQQTSDDAHPGWPEFGVSEDPLRFPASDDALVAALDERIASALADEVTTFVSQSRSAALAEAVSELGVHPTRGLQRLLAVALAAPDAVDGATRATLRLHLQERYELEQPDALLAATW
jgi:hypothetical protein